MTLVVVGKGLVLRGLASKTEVIWVLGTCIPEVGEKHNNPIPIPKILSNPVDQRKRVP